MLSRRSGARDARAMLRRLLLQGRIVLLLDGLDEVARPAYDAVQAAIYDFIHAHEDADLPTGLARVVITCRRQDYRQIEADWSTWFATPGDNIRVLRRDRLGGLIHEYSQVSHSLTPIFGTHGPW